MTKQIELPSGRYLLVKVPKDQSYFDLYGGNTPNSIEYNTMSKPGKFKRESIKLPEGHTYTLIGKADQLTEDQWKGIVGKYHLDEKYEDYFTKQDPDSDLHGFFCPMVNTAIESGLSLLKAHGFEIDTTLILKID